MEKPVLTPHEFTVLSLLEVDRYYNLSDIRDLHSKFMSTYGNSLNYLKGDTYFAKIIYQLMQRGYLVKAKRSGCVLLLRLSHTALEQVVQGDKL